MPDEEKPPTLGSETATAGPTPPAARSEPVEIDHGQGEAKSRPLELPPPAAAERPAQGEQGGLVVVGIGASAGGLEALSELIRYVPIDHLAYIVVQHLAPHHESILTQLLARDSRLEILTATDGMVLEANRVYVIPPNADLAVLQGVLRVFTPPTVHGPRMPIDYLFRSLADDRGGSVIGIILSGTGTDGTFGLKAIKDSGGITFAQDPSTAKYDGMPRSALQSGAADYCLPPKEIGEELGRIARQLHLRPAPHEAIPSPHVQDQLGKLFILIRSEFGNDLTNYKPSTIDRRIERRMTLHKIGRIEDYVRYVQSSRDELHALYKDMLITVTSFFRDPEAFEALKSQVFPQIFEHKEPNASMRVWVPACATGEEAYSIAMCLLEYCEENARGTRIQIFGTDIDEDAIQQARRGVYQANITLEVSPERINRFFVKKADEYHIARRVRDMLVFSQHNVLKDAPFSRMDLVSCRNLLIYLQPAAQKKVLRILHYALNPIGCLLLGSSETVGEASDLFSPLDRKTKLYVKRPVAPHAGLDMAFAVPVPGEPTQLAVPPHPPLTLQALADRKVLELYGPAGVIINEHLEILQFRGHTGPYLDPAPGAASLNILKVARFELHIGLKRAIQQALATQQRVTTEITYADEGKRSVVRLDVVPLSDPETKTRTMLVLFHRMPPPKEVPVVATDEGKTGETVAPLAQRIQELERELTVTKEYLQGTVKENESTLEELQSANEELQSSNEELQSTNEELETSREEMQSTNEELTTVNEELQNRMAELSQINDDLHNVLAGVDNAVVIVGMDLRIRRYTGAAEKLLNLVPGDLGRSIGFIDSFLGAGPVEPKVSQVIANLSTTEEEILTSNHRWYSLKISPYKTLDYAIRGALITLVDIDVRKRAAEIARNVGAYADRFLGAIGQPLLIIDRKLRVVWANAAFLSTFQVTMEETVGSTLATVGAHQLADPGLRERVEGVFVSGSVFRDHVMSVRGPEPGKPLMRVGVGGSQVPASTETPLVLLSIEPRGYAPAQGTP
jgi:two-component system CheB/CheR fusion protein